MRRIEHNADTSSHSLRRKVLSEDSADLQKGNKDTSPWERNDNEWNSHQNSMSRREEKATTYSFPPEQDLSIAAEEGIPYGEK